VQEPASALVAEAVSAAGRSPASRPGLPGGYERRPRSTLPLLVSPAKDSRPMFDGQVVLHGLQLRREAPERAPADRPASTG